LVGCPSGQRSKASKKHQFQQRRHSGKGGSGSMASGAGREPGLIGADFAADMRHRPYFLCERRVRSSSLTTHPRQAEGARDALGPGARKFTQVCANRCSDPRASTPRDIEAYRSPYNRKSAVLWRPARGVCRSAPYRPRWSYLSGNPCSPFGLRGRLTTASGPGRERQSQRPAAVPAIAGPSDARLVRQDDAAWTAGPWCAHLRHHVIPRPPLPVSCLEMLDQTSLGSETGFAEYSPQ
jgi:hypothetical protein